MQARPLGSTGLWVSEIGLGTSRMALSDAERSARDPQDFIAAKDILRSAKNLGCTHFDTADGYGFGASELLLGSYLSECHSHDTTLVITTKIGWNFYNIMVAPEIKKYVKQELNLDLDQLPEGDILPFDHGQNFSFEYLSFALDRSLERLNVNSVDILLLHVPSLAILTSTPWDEHLKRLQGIGKCHCYGVSVRHPIEVIAALNHGEPAVIQVPISIVISKPMNEALLFAKRRGVGVIGRELFVQGLLLKHLAKSGVLKDKTSDYIEMFPRTIIDEVMNNGLVDAVIIGSSNLQQVQENMGESTYMTRARDRIRELVNCESRAFFTNSSHSIPRLDGDSVLDAVRDINRYKSSKIHHTSKVVDL